MIIEPRKTSPAFLAKSFAPAFSALTSPKFLLLATGLLVSLGAIRLLHLEEDLGLFQLFTLAIGGAAVNTILPQRIRLPFIFSLTILSGLLLFGALNGLAILGYGLLLFTILNLPISVRIRLVLLVAVGTVLALGKTGYLGWVVPNTTATVIGGLFMFRSMIYLYEMQHEKTKPDLWIRLNYFFLLPNLIFVIFPVVDYKTFNRSYQQVPLLDTATTGLHWIMRGLLHLFLYRIIYYYLIPAPSQIDSVFTVIQYMAMSYALIIRLSGIFHLSTGIIRLLGFNLPPTFDNYFLATGFSDLWRRINIYWKDFMMKVFYFPIYFEFKRRNNLAVFVTVMIVFGINWLLHQYQWFWIRGNFPIRAVDLIFWGVFGLLVAINSIYQKNRKKKRKSSAGFSWSVAAATTLKIMGMLVFMSLLWSLWISPTIDAWWQLLQRSGHVSGGQIALLFSGAMLLWISGILAFYIHDQLVRRQKIFSENSRLFFYVLGWLLALVIVLPPTREIIGTKTSFDFGPVLETRLNAADEEQLFQGYYEDLLIGNNLNSRMWEVEEDRKGKTREPQERFKATGILREIDGSLEKRIESNSEIVFKQAPLTTNEFGIRDRSYDSIPSTGTLRFVLLGGSAEMGSGVADSLTFENVVEDSLNANLGAWTNYEKVEILNFAVAGTHLPEQVGMTENVIADFHPKVLIYAIHPEEAARGLKSFLLLTQTGLIDSFPRLQAIYSKAGITSTTKRSEMLRLLTPYLEQLSDWGVGRIAKWCEVNGVIPICLRVPTLGKDERNNVQADAGREIEEVFLKYGFHLIDLTGSFGNTDRESLKVAKWDNHPNALAHQLIAKKLLQQLERDQFIQQLLNPIQ